MSTETNAARRLARARADARNGADRSTPDGRVLVGERPERGIRWRPGDRFQHLFEERCDLLRATGESARLAVDGVRPLTYDELDARANRFARYLLARGVRPGDRIGLLFDQAVLAYVGMLAVLKVHAVYVPLDVGYPPDRLAYIVADADVRLVLTQSHLGEPLAAAGVDLIRADEVDTVVAQQDSHRLTEAETGAPAGEICYIIYTSGSTGRPKGVPIEHAAICNFVRVAAEVYGFEPADRVYQGMTIAFDFAVEELWVPLAVGATLVPKPSGVSLLGDELGEFLSANRITAMCCVPTLLATLDRELPGLRFLLVSGEACPRDLVARWHRPGRRFLNVYGPTEATVTATWTPVVPDRPVTIGVPLPTYSVVILDPDAESQALHPGELGEIGIAGVGLSPGYLNRDELTDRVFVPDFLGIEDNPSGRIYRTGDLGRINADGEIEYHGRIDTQVKVRGYRIELTEIESVLLRTEGVAQAVVDTYEPEPGVVELVGYYSVRPGATGADPERIYRELRDRLPSYMIPAYLEELAAIPMLPSDKADRKRLPPPSGRRLADRADYTAPSTELEWLLAEAMSGVLRLDRVSVDSDFFADLGANSLLLAHFCTSVRRRDERLSVSMREVYLHPSVGSLAAALAAAGGFDVTDDIPAATDGAPDIAARIPAPRSAPPDIAAITDPTTELAYATAASAAEIPAPRSAEPAVTPGEAVVAPVAADTRVATRRGRVPVCGALQVLAFVGYLYLVSVIVTAGYDWAAAYHGVFDLYLRSLAIGGGGFLVIVVLPILAKWLLVGRWTRQVIPVWSLRYVRFWLVKSLIRANPIVLFAGSPLYLMYLRALGARIGRGAVILSHTVPVCTDLLTVGAGTVVRKDCDFAGYRARAGAIETGAVTVGRDVFVGERTVLDIGTVLGDGAQLGHSSSLHQGQVIPAGEHWHGSPALRCDTDYDRATPARCGSGRRFSYATVQLLGVVFLWAPLLVAAAALLIDPALLTGWPLIADLIGPAERISGTSAFWFEALAASAALFFGALAIGLVLVIVIPRLLGRLFLKPDRVYPLYGIHYWAERTIARITNIRFYMMAFGDSSAIPHYLRALGYDLSRLVQTGSNFGVEQKHETPMFSVIGSGTMVSDGLSMANAEFSSSSFRMVRTEIGPDNFLGNDLTYPAGGRTGANCLIGTRTMIPLDGPVRSDVGLLGSPCFEIPRSVRRDDAARLMTDEEIRRGLAAKNRHNLVTALFFLLVRWLEFSVVAVFGVLAGNTYERFGTPVIAADLVVSTAFVVGLAVFAERAGAAFRRLRPQVCSIYDPYFRWHERFWKMSVGPMLGMFNGTPMKSVIWRLLGVRVGRRVFDDGLGLVEKTMVTIGDDCTMNFGSIAQGHSLEDGLFKSDRITIGPGCTLGVQAFAHYGVTMGAGSVLDAHAFLMKGEAVPPDDRWRGNPAMPLRQARPVRTARSA